MNPKFYFQHDNYSRDDEKLIEVRMKHQMAGIGTYWCLVEMLHEGNGYIETKPKLLAFQLQVPEEIINDVVEICFKVEDGKITCDRVKENLAHREEIRLKKSEAGKKGMASRYGSNTAANERIQDILNGITDVNENGNSVITDDSSVITTSNIEKEKGKEKGKGKETDKKIERLKKIFKFEILEGIISVETISKLTPSLLKAKLDGILLYKIPNWEEEVLKRDVNSFLIDNENKIGTLTNEQQSAIKAYKFLITNN